MGIKIICNNCRAVLYDDEELISPREIIDKYDSSCPKCFTSLSFDPSKIFISINEKPQRGLFRIKPF
ncbi:MAG: hypothetical protein NZ922_00540 [Candidatus Methanomethyliaceae archaeon]|nr:hypothetical protein [Candidatus Methanomethyliaceae archaeon]MDW7970438.1 hypothetical protein [Nitrososphaerota archaeon]